MDNTTVTFYNLFITNFYESDMLEIYWITLPSHVCTFLVIFIGLLSPDLSHICNICSECVPNKCKIIGQRKLILFIKEFVIIVIPLLFLTTVSSNNVLCMVIPMTIIIACNFIFLRVARFNYPVFSFFPHNISILLKLPIPDSKRSFVTCCRSIVNIMTVISILAVDFNIFPRRFSKSGKYGYSLMDVGVGFFILSNAGVTKIEKISKGGLKQTVLGCVVLFMLGLIRYYLVQRIDYHTNVDEYGVHWNFFFTLGTTKLLSFITMKMFCMQALLPGIILGIIHQLLLFYGLEEYVMSDKPRDNWIDANREGLVSTLGFTSLYLIAISMNKFVLKKSTTIGGDLKTVAKLMFLSVVFILLTISFSGLFPVCRRLASLTYITWILSIALVHVVVAMLVEIFMICLISSSHSKTFYSFLTPVTFESINYNGLTFFLIANLFTGLVNILFNTMQMSTVQSIFILVVYMLVNCGIVYHLYFSDFQIKFW